MDRMRVGGREEVDRGREGSSGRMEGSMEERQNWREGGRDQQMVCG